MPDWPPPAETGRPVAVVLLTAKNVGNHVHSAYSSHMCPK